MAKPQTENPLEKNAQKYFRKAEQSETLAKQMRKKELASDAAKIVKLRGLRMAKEAADKIKSDKLAVEKGGTKPTTRRPSQRKQPTARMIY